MTISRRAVSRIIGGDRLEVVDVNRLPIDYGSTTHRATVQWCLKTDWASRRSSIPSNFTELISVREHKHTRIRCSTDSGRILSDGVQHRLDISGRAGNHAENLARSGLLFERFGELTLTILQLFGR